MGNNKYGASGKPDEGVICNKCSECDFRKFFAQLARKEMTKMNDGVDAGVVAAMEEVKLNQRAPRRRHR